MYEGRGMYKAVLENVPEIEASGNTDTFKRHTVCIYLSEDAKVNIAKTCKEITKPKK